MERHQIFSFAITMSIACCALPFIASGQEKSQPNGSAFDIAVSAAPGTVSGALAWFRMHKIVKQVPGLQVGYGVRLSSFIGANKFYVTAPARHTSPAQNLTTIFSETIEENIDTITTATAATNSLNAAIYIQYSITPKIDFGLNIDAIGFSFGPQRQFNVISSVFDPNQSPVQTGSPTQLNLLLTSDNDIGSLNSEFFLRYWLNERLGLRAGYTFLFSEYQLDMPLSFDDGRIINDRYRYKSSMVLFALTYRILK